MQSGREDGNSVLPLHVPSCCLPEGCRYAVNRWLGLAELQGTVALNCVLCSMPWSRHFYRGVKMEKGGYECHPPGKVIGHVILPLVSILGNRRRESGAIQHLPQREACPLLFCLALPSSVTPFCRALWSHLKWGISQLIAPFDPSQLTPAQAMHQMRVKLIQQRTLA
jgi:hypothetical protein